MRAVVLVEGESDRNAVLALLARTGSAVDVVAMGGATNIGHALQQFRGRELHGLYDEAEARFFRQALERHGFGTDLTETSLQQLGFHCCRKDLEDELIRALGVDRVLDVLERNGDGHAFRTFRQQPAQAGRPDTARLRRFLGAGSGRKIRYGTLLTQALPDGDVPDPLRRLVTGVTGVTGGAQAYSQP